MPLPSEVDYWNSVANKSVSMGSESWTFTDNSWKRPDQLRRLFEYKWIDEKILEIGTGNAVTGGILRMVTGKGFDYTGTELSSNFIRWAKGIHNLNVIQADVRELPGQGYTRIIAFDALEHVRPEHRKEGYAKIAEVAKEGCLLFLHYSYGTSYHDKEFDHPFGTEDLLELEKAGWTMLKYERYICDHPQGAIPYVFVVMQK